jgi:hypothetical protein
MATKHAKTIEVPVGSELILRLFDFKNQMFMNAVDVISVSMVCKLTSSGLSDHVAHERMFLGLYEKKCLIYFKNKQTFNIENVEMSDLSSLDMPSAPMTPKSKTRGWVVIVLLLSVAALIGLGVYVIFFNPSGEAGVTGANGAAGPVGPTGPASPALVDLSQIENLIMFINEEGDGFQVNELNDDNENTFRQAYTGWYDSVSGLGELTIVITVSKIAESGNLNFELNPDIVMPGDQMLKFTKVSNYLPVPAFSSISPQTPVFGFVMIYSDGMGFRLEGLPSSVSAGRIIYSFTLPISSIPL